MNKTGLIMEGGAMRGMFTAGAMDVLMEHDITFDGAIGVSAGAAFGCNYKSKQIGRVLRYNTTYVQDKRFCGLRVFAKTGNFFSTDFCYGEIPMKLDVFDFDTYEQNPMDFYVVCTDVETGAPVYHKHEGRADHCFDWILASASMPLVSKIVELEGKKLLDGGIADSIPVRYFQQIGFQKNVVILTQPKDYIKHKNQLMPLMKLRYKKYPKFLKAIEERHIFYNETTAYIEEQERLGNLLVLRPQEALPVSRVERDPKKLTEAYELGRKAAEDRIAEIQAFLGE